MYFSWDFSKKCNSIFCVHVPFSSDFVWYTKCNSGQYQQHAYISLPMSDLVTQKPTRYNGKEKCQGVGYWYGHRQLSGGECEIIQHRTTLVYKERHNVLPISDEKLKLHQELAHFPIFFHVFNSTASFFDKGICSTPHCSYHDEPSCWHTVSHNEVPGQEILLRYRRNLLYLSSLQHVRSVVVGAIWNVNINMFQSGPKLRAGQHSGPV